MLNATLIKAAQDNNFEISKNTIYGYIRGNLISISLDDIILTLIINVNHLNSQERKVFLKELISPKPDKYRRSHIDNDLSCIVISFTVFTENQILNFLNKFLANIPKGNLVDFSKKKVILNQYPVYEEDVVSIEKGLLKRAKPLSLRFASVFGTTLVLGIVLSMISYKIEFSRFAQLIFTFSYLLIFNKLYLDKSYKSRHSFSVEVFSFSFLSIFYYISNALTVIYINHDKNLKFNYETILLNIKNNFTEVFSPIQLVILGFYILFIFTLRKSIKGLEAAKPEAFPDLDDKHIQYQKFKKKFNSKYIPAFVITWLIFSVASGFYVIFHSFAGGYNYETQYPLLFVEIALFIPLVILLNLYFDSLAKLDPNFEIEKGKSRLLNFIAASMASFLVCIGMFPWVMYANVNLDSSPMEERKAYTSELMDQVVKVDTCNKTFTEDGKEIPISLCEKKHGMSVGKEKFTYLYKKGFFGTGLYFPDSVKFQNTWKDLIDHRKSEKNIGYASIAKLMKNKDEMVIIRDKVPAWENDCKKGSNCKLLAFIAEYDDNQKDAEKLYQQGCEFNDAQSCYSLSGYKKDDNLLAEKTEKLLNSECNEGIVRSCKIFYRSYQNKKDPETQKKLSEIMKSECARGSGEACDLYQLWQNRI